LTADQAGLYFAMFGDGVPRECQRWLMTPTSGADVRCNLVGRARMRGLAFGPPLWLQALVESTADTAANALGCLEVHNAMTFYHGAVHGQGAVHSLWPGAPHKGRESPLRASARNVPSDEAFALKADRMSGSGFESGTISLNQHNDVSVGRVIRTPGKTWQMPQGGSDEGAVPLAAAQREEVGADNVQVLAENDSGLNYELRPDLIVSFVRQACLDVLERYRTAGSAKSAPGLRHPSVTLSQAVSSAKARSLLR